MKSKKLTNLGRRKALEPQLNWLTGKDEALPIRTNQIKDAFPDWLEALNQSGAENRSNAAAKADVCEFIGAARAIGKGHTNIAIALTQILAESLHGNGNIEGVPPIHNWNDVTAILRAISSAELGMDLWAKAAGVDKILDIVHVQENE